MEEITVREMDPSDGNGTGFEVTFNGQTATCFDTAMSAMAYAIATISHYPTPPAHVSQKWDEWETGARGTRNLSYREAAYAADYRQRTAGTAAKRMAGYDSVPCSGPCCRQSELAAQHERDVAEMHRITGTKPGEAPPAWY